MPGILMVHNAGYGTTPLPADALMKPGETMTIHDENNGTTSEAKLLGVVPAGGCIEYAIADQNGEPRPLTVSDNLIGETLYVFEHKGHRLYIPQTDLQRGMQKFAEKHGDNAQ